MAFGSKKNASGDASVPEQGEDGVTVPEAAGPTRVSRRQAAKAQAAAEKQPASRRPKRAGDLLGSVISESVFGSAMELLENNENFVYSPGQWFVLLLDVTDIGGLSEKQKHDESKGSILNLINGDMIQIVATAQMIEHQQFALIPTESTMVRAEEYELLANALYRWAVLSAEGDRFAIKVFEQKGTYFDSAKQVAAGSIPLVEALAQVDEIRSALLGGEGASITEREDASAVASAAQPADTEGPFEVGAAEIATADEQAQVQDEQAFQPIEYALPEEEIAADEDASPVYEDEVPDYETVILDEPEEPLPASDEQPEAVATTGGLLPGTVSYENYLVETVGSVFTQEDQHAVIARRFLTDDLDLEVDLEEFNAIFAPEAPAAHFNLSAALANTTDWLTNQVGQLVETANTQIEERRLANIDELRRLYVELIGVHMGEVAEIVSTTEPGAPYYEMLQTAELDHSRRIGDSDALVARRREEISKSFDDEAEARAIAIAAQAKAEALQTSRPRREARLAEVEPAVRSQLQADYEHDRQKVLELRRSTAQIEMERGRTKIIAALSEKRDAQQAEMQAMVASLTAGMLEVIDANRKSDLARAQTLAESLVHDDSVEVERQRAETRLAEVRADHQARLAELEQARAQQVDHLTGQLNEREAYYAGLLGAQEKRADDAVSLVSTIKQSVHEEYAARLATLEADKRSYGEQLDYTNKLGLRSNRLIIGLGSVALVAALLLGSVVGFTISRVTTDNTHQDSAPGAIVLTVDDE